LDIALATAAIVVLAVLVGLRSSLVQQQTSLPSTYDTGPRGYGALYALLARERVPVERFEEPIADLAGYRGTLVVAGDYHLLAVAGAAGQRDALDAWVRRGNTLTLLGTVPFWMRDSFGVPQDKALRANLAIAGCGLALQGLHVSAPFTRGFDGQCTRDRSMLLRASNRAVALAYRRGKGTVIYSPAVTMLDNEHLAQSDNAYFAYAILSRGPILFEERGYGHARGNGFWQVLPLAMRVAIVLAAAALLLGIAGANLPFAPPQLPAAGDERDSGEYIASLSQMLQRGGAQRAVVQRLCAYVQSALGPRAHADAQARELLEQARSLQSLSGPRTEDVLEAGRLFARVRKDYKW
jgi:hypothetical protein